MPPPHPKAICQVIERKSGFTAIPDPPDDRRNTTLRISVMDHIKRFIFFDRPAEILGNRVRTTMDSRIALPSEPDEVIILRNMFGSLNKDCVIGESIIEAIISGF